MRIVFLLILFLFVTNPVSAQEDAVTQDEAVVERDKALVIIYTADWCSICVYMNPRWEDVMFIMDDEDVEFMAVDYSNDDTEMKSYEQLVGLGIGDRFFNNNARQAGIGIVLDKNLKEKYRINSSMTKRRMVYYIREAINAGKEEQKVERLNEL